MFSQIQPLLAPLLIERTAPGALLLALAVLACGVVASWVGRQLLASRRRRWTAAVGQAIRARDREELARITSDPELSRGMGEAAELIAELDGFLAEDEASRDAADDEARTWRARFEHLPVPLFVIGPTRRVIWANAAAGRLAGRARGELDGYPWDALVRDDPQGEEARRLAPVFGERREMRSLAARLERPDGTTTAVLVAEGFLEEPAGRGSCCVVLGLEGVERRLDEPLDAGPDARGAASREETGEDEHLEAMARLAAGVAHDFNDKLTAILGNASLLAERVADAELREPVNEIVLSAEQLRRLTHQLLAFSRRGVGRARVILLNEALRGARATVEDLAGADTAVVWRLDPDAGHVRATPEALAEILAALVRNAVEAMEGRGRITLESERVVEPGQPSMAVLRVRDQGPGMDEEARARAFEPCYTSKGGRTVGLGLSAVHGLVRQGGGSIRVAAEASGGTCVEISWPQSASWHGAPEDAQDGAGGGQRTICVVEDDDRVRRLVVDVVRREGHRVLEAGDAETALEILRAEERPIDLLLTDFHLPGMDGHQLLERLRAERGVVPVVFMSGYVDDDVFRTSMLSRFEFLAKPFRPRDLVERLRSVLGGPPQEKRRRRVLVVDDEEAVRETLSALLETLEVDCVEAGDGREALDALEHTSVDAVISDMVMPDLDGLQACAEIRRRYPDVSLIAMSGHPKGSPSLAAAVELGAVTALSKPFSKDELALALQAAFENR